jgi:hypothetical protein
MKKTNLQFGFLSTNVKVRTLCVKIGRGGGARE